MSTYASQFESELAKLVDAEITELSSQLTNPGSAPTLEEYRFHLGQIDGLRRADSLRAEANDILTKRDR